MALLKIAVVALIAFSLVVAHEGHTHDHMGEEEFEKDLVVLTDATFDESVKTGNWFLKFYAPWCGHCKRLAPAWAELAHMLKGEVNVAKIDCTTEKEVCNRFGIRGYPTLKFKAGDQLYSYKGARTVEALKAFATSEYSSGTPEPYPGAKLPNKDEP